MNMHTESHEDADRRAGDDALAQLIRQAGRRPAPPPEVYRQVLQATSEVWARKVRARRRTRFAYALAASVLIAVGVVGLLRQIPGPGDTPVPVATVDHGFGLLMVKGPTDEAWRTLGDGDAGLVPGARIRTGDDSGLGLKLAGGGSLRLAAQTEVSMDAADRIHLDKGTAYLDTGHGGGSKVEIITPLGSVRHVGTQFETTYTVNEMRLRVREGLVRLQHGDDSIRAAAGAQVVIDFEGTVVESTITPYGEHWEWVQALAPMPETDEQPLSEFLDWIARETGRRVHFANRDLSVRAHTTMLHGQTGRMMPMEALAVMLQTTDFQYTVTGDSEILIQDRRL